VKQLLQDVSSGELTVTEVPAPIRAPGALLVATSVSLISAGTERAVMDLGSKSLVGKARARPDLARKVVGSVREEGLRTAYGKVRGRLAEPNPLGYSSCGVVLEAPDDAPAGPGELVACAGAGYASHAEIVSVPRQLCARVPEGVSPEQAAYATVVAIALHGVRLCELQLGDVVAVVGLGLVGQLTLELVQAARDSSGSRPSSRPRRSAARRGGAPTASW
jgi:threonine dehydrogenase-like Zn-dependent dehydrogenase